MTKWLGREQILSLLAPGGRGLREARMPRGAIGQHHLLSPKLQRQERCLQRRWRWSRPSPTVWFTFGHCMAPTRVPPNGQWTSSDTSYAVGGSCVGQGQEAVLSVGCG